MLLQRNRDLFYVTVLEVWTVYEPPIALGVMSSVVFPYLAMFRKEGMEM